MQSRFRARGGRVPRLPRDQLRRTAVAAIAYLIVVLVLTLPDPPVFALTAGAVGICIGVPLIVYPFAKTTWAAIDFLLHRGRS